MTTTSAAFGSAYLPHTAQPRLIPGPVAGLDAFRAYGPAFAAAAPQPYPYRHSLLPGLVETGVHDIPPCFPARHALPRLKTTDFIV